MLKVRVVARPRYAGRMDQPTVELMVRLTARLSAAAFAAALILFASGYQHDRRRLSLATRLFAGFIVAHSIHFLTVIWLAVVTAGENIQERDGWAVVIAVGLLFYVAVFLVLRGWRDATRGHSPSRGPGVTADVAVVAIAAVFLNSYLGRVGRMPIFWWPAAALAGTVALYFVRTRRSTLPS